MFIHCLNSVHLMQQKKKRFDTSNYEANRPLPKGRNEKVTG